MSRSHAAAAAPAHQPVSPAAHTDQQRVVPDGAAAALQASQHAPAIADLRSLGATLGNRALARAVQAGRFGAAGMGGRVLARSSGLRRAERVLEFADDALAYWRDPANTGKPLEDYAKHLMTKVNKMLKALDSFESKYVIDHAGSASGTFSRVTWTITINPDKFSDRANVTKVGDLTADEAAEIADTIYHESRHSEQYFRIARVQAGRLKAGTKQPGARIAKDMSIPRDVADAAAAAPLTATTTGNEDFVGEAEDWEDITVGRHGDYKGNINAWGNEARALDDELKGVTAATVGAVKKELEATLSAWKKDKDRQKFVKTHLSKTNKIEKKTTVDNRVVTHLTKIKQALEALDTAATTALKGWNNIDAGTRLQRLESLQAPSKTLNFALYDAYRSHIHEEDAWATGRAVGGTFRDKQAEHLAAEKAAKKKAAKKKAAKKKVKSGAKGKAPKKSVKTGAEKKAAEKTAATVLAGPGTDEESV